MNNYFYNYGVAGALTTRSYINIYFIIILLVGIVFRLIMPFRGHNFDLESYRIVADIIEHGGNVYAETKRYNYGPIWFYILHILDAIPWNTENKVIELHWKVASFLSMVDVGIFLILFRMYGIIIAALFFLNPISIIITGYHSQFDNLAILLGLISVIFIEKRERRILVFIGLLVMGISLSVKHILFIFPIWLAFKEIRLSRKLLFIFIPYFVFLLGFVFFMKDGWDGILHNVFLYKSFNNAPFWSDFTPYSLYTLVPPIFLFIAALLVIGLFWRSKKAIESLHLYLISLVVFSSAIANQYLAICTSSIATQWNMAYAAYSLVGTVFLLVEGNGLHIYFLQNLIGWDGDGGYYLLIALLSFGLLKTALAQKSIDALLNFFKVCIRWLIKEIKVQAKAPW